MALRFLLIPVIGLLVFTQVQCLTNPGVCSSSFDVDVFLYHTSRLQGSFDFNEGPRLHGSNLLVPSMQFRKKESLTVNNAEISNTVKSNLCKSNEITMYGSTFFKKDDVGGPIVELRSEADGVMASLAVCRNSNEIVISYKHNGNLTFHYVPHRFSVGMWHKLAVIMSGNLLAVYIDCIKLTQKIIPSPDYCPKGHPVIVAGATALNDDQMSPCSTKYMGSLESVGIVSGINSLTKCCPNITTKVHCPICGPVISLINESNYFKTKLSECTANLTNVTSLLSRLVPLSCVIEGNEYTNGTFAKKTNGEICFCLHGVASCIHPDSLTAPSPPVNITPPPSPPSSPSSLATSNNPPSPGSVCPDKKVGSVDFFDTPIGSTVYGPSEDGSKCESATCHKLFNTEYWTERTYMCNKFSSLNCSLITDEVAQNVTACCNFCDACLYVSCPANSKCSRTGRKFECKCDKGFRKSEDTNTCIDIDECSEGTATCPSLSTCMNTIGDYTCVCADGYELMNPEDKMNRYCDDINECVTGNYNCSKGYACSNTIPGYDCICAKGYTGEGDECIPACGDGCQNGGTCSSPNKCDCVEGFKGKYCETDINECTDGTNGMNGTDLCPHFNSTCVNTHGGYFCRCDEGYQFNSIHRECEDVNECLNNNGDCLQLCNNTVGSYFCSCYSGYTKNEQNICQDIDECSLNDHGCHHMCVNQVGSYMCACFSGYTFDEDGITCILQNCFIPLEIPVNGNLSCTNGQVTNSTCITSCDAGYQLTGPSAERTCFPNGSWSEPPVTCEPKTCPVLEQPDNGYVRAPCSRDFGSECSLQCVHGFAVDENNRTFTCDLHENEFDVQWSDIGTCERQPVCTNDTCVHGKCVEISSTEFYCDCNGTLYTGKLCQKGLVLVPEIGALTTTQPLQFQLTVARPDVDLQVDFQPCASFSGIFFRRGISIHPCKQIIDSSTTETKFLLTGHDAGIYYIDLSLSGTNARDFTAPDPIPVIVGSEEGSTYFKHLDHPYVYSSCCQPFGSMAVLKCGMNPKLGVQLSSSCGWETLENGNVLTNGIVFSHYNDLALPVSLAGLELTKEQSVSETRRELTISSSCSTCNSTKLYDISSNNSCYEYIPTPDDLQEFITSQSLTVTYIAEIQSKLLPNWLTISVPDDPNALRRSTESDYSLSIISVNKVTELNGCESIILDKIGHFSVLQHNGELKLSLLTKHELFENITLTNIEGSIFCSAVELCSGNTSSVYIAIPLLAQHNLHNISFINEHILKDWQLTFKSFIIHQYEMNTDFPIYEYWNGVEHGYMPFMKSDLIISMEAEKSFRYYDINVAFKFSGNLGYNYVIDNEINQLITSGEHSLTISSRLQGKMENFHLENVSSSAFAYHNSASSFKCSSSVLPSGIGIKLSYKTLSTESFYFSLFQLPYDTQYCPVDAFIHLNSSKDMNGFSYYSNCLELLYDSLVFPKLTHQFHIPMATDTFCLNLTQNFDDISSYGLVIQSSLSSDLTYYQLNPILKLFSGANNVTMTMAISSSIEDKIGILHSVEITLLDGPLTTSLMLHNDELSFSGSTIAFNNELYFVHLKGVSKTTTSWDQLDISLEGWFPRGKGGFVDLIESSVQHHLNRTADRAIMRIEAAEEQTNLANERYIFYQAQLESAKDTYQLMKQSQDDLMSRVLDAEITLNETEELVANANDDVKTAERAMDDLCMIETCSKVCAPTTRIKVVTEHKYATKLVEIEELRLKSVLRPFNLYYLVDRWVWSWVCTRRFIWFFLIWFETQSCNYRCVRVQVLERTVHYQAVYELQLCTVPKEVTVYKGTVERTEQITDPCGKMVPETSCGIRNDRCQRERQNAFDLIDRRREGLTEPLRQLNNAKRTLAILRNNITKAELSTQTAQNRLDKMKVLYTKAEQKLNASRRLLETIKETDTTGYQIYKLLEDNVTVSEMFSVKNVSFSVNHGTEDTPYVFPITISYTSADYLHILSTPYHFRTEFQSQKDLLVNTIVDDILELSVISRRETRQTEITDDYGELQFQSRCIRLTSLGTFLNDLHSSLEDLKSTKQEIDLQIQMSYEAIQSLNATTNFSDLLSINFTSLQNSFNISLEEINEIKTTIEIDSSELASIVDVINDLYKDLLNYENSAESDLVTEWQNEVDLLYDDFTLGNSNCFGLKDCILVFTSEVENLLDFAPASYTDNITTLLPNATQNLLMLSSNESFSLAQAFMYLMPMADIIETMNQTGYWCAKPPVFEEIPDILTNVSVGHTLVLKCNAESLLPLSYQWRKDGVVLNGATNKIFELNNFQVFDEGNYTCDVTNAVRTVQSPNISVLAFELPQFYLTPVSIITYFGNANGALFTCNATSLPAPGWKWFHKTSLDQSWEEIEGEDTNELFISQPTMTDVGWYMCLAYNYHGNISSDPVYLRLVSVTARVDSIPINFVLEKIDNGADVNKREEPNSIENIILNYLKFNLSIDNSSIRNLRISTTDDGNSYSISFLLVSTNTTVNYIGMESLGVVISRLRLSYDELINKKNNIQSNFSKNITIRSPDVSFIPVLSSFTVQNEQILCPAGQELHSNTILCVDCLEGQHQVNVTVSREINGRIIEEVVSRCTDCPLNTYQDKIKGPECIPCPSNHITLSTGTTSRDGCIALCPPNHISRTGLAPCERCPKGMYQSEYGESHCKDCQGKEDNITCIINPCELELSIGNCTSSILRVYYDIPTQKCQSFQYSGCGANKNNFASFTECTSSCGCPNNGTVIECEPYSCLDSCSNFPNATCMPDPCDSCKARYYDHNGREVTNICTCPDTYSLISCPDDCTATCQVPNPTSCTRPTECMPDCGCPDGTVLDETTKLCIKPTQCDTCSLAANPGPCNGAYPRWFFNSTSSQCEHFSFGGCYGNKNQFTSLEHCINECGCPSNKTALQCTTNPCEQSNCPSFPNSVCEVDKCGNECVAKYYSVFADVTSHCDTCSLPLNIGTCKNGSVSRWFFDKNTGRCQIFEYSGCQGNENNFITLKDCLATCVPCSTGLLEVSCKPDPCSTASCPNYPEAICVTNSCGQCSFRFHNSTGYDITELCDVHCPLGLKQVTCDVNPCDHHTCQKYPEAVCTIDNCGTCKSKFILNDTDVTDECGDMCPIEGQFFQSCSTCTETCEDIDLQRPKLCPAICQPGCNCPAGQVVDEASNKCVFPENCPCPKCDPLPHNCSSYISISKNERCNCSICTDCSVEGQVYQEKGSCPLMCSNPYQLCKTSDSSGCGCPAGQYIDEKNNRCVNLNDCPEIDPCMLPQFQGPCNTRIQRYFYNSTSAKCELFYYGGCHANKNNFFSKHQCEKACSNCPPTCTVEFCSINRGGLCTVRPDSVNGSAATCHGGNCIVTSCWACYYSYTKLSFPEGALACIGKEQCSLATANNESNEYDENCLKRWGRCVRIAYIKTFRDILPHEKVEENFQCWDYPCLGNN
jgi:hypothetical protein